MPNGKEFVMVYPTAAQAPATAAPRPHINIVLNWFEELTTRVPAH
jgi:hypothetical protein